MAESSGWELSVAATLLLDLSSWDLVLDAHNNVAVAQPPYQLAQDAAAAMQCNLGEQFWDTTQGVNYQAILGSFSAQLAQIKQALTNAALSVPGVATAQVFLNALTPGRGLSGQVQVVGVNTTTSTAPFSVANLQGSG